MYNRPMKKSILSKGKRTAVPLEVREKPGVAPERPEFFKHKGAIRVGSGSAVEDVKKARAFRGTDGR